MLTAPLCSDAASSVMFPLSVGRAMLSTPAGPSAREAVHCCRRVWPLQPDQPRRDPRALQAAWLERGRYRAALQCRPDSVVGQRCVIPADGFYEWQALPGRKKPQPLHIRLTGGGLFGFAGIYAGRPERRDDANYAIITTSPNELVAQVHNRMPVILDPGDEALWLDSAVTSPLAVLGCLRPYPSERMEAYPVSPLVGAAWNEGPELVEPVTQPLSQAPLGLFSTPPA